MSDFKISILQQQQQQQQKGSLNRRVLEIFWEISADD